MGVVYEFNWFLVAENEKVIEKKGDNLYYLHKDEKRIYPVDFSIPLIIKNIGCIGQAYIEKIEIQKNATNITFSMVEEYNVDDSISDHYYKKYLDFKMNCIKNS